MLVTIGDPMAGIASDLKAHRMKVSPLEAVPAAMTLEKEPPMKESWVAPLDLSLPKEVAKGSSTLNTPAVVAPLGDTEKVGVSTE